MDEPETRQAVDFEPVAVATERRRRIDPLVVGPVVVAIGLLVAIGWPDAQEQVEITATPDVAERTTAPSAGPTFDPQVLGLDPEAVIAAESRARSIPDVGAWGVRTFRMAQGRIDDRWKAVEPGEGSIAPLVVVDSPSVVLVEITTPRDETPLDARVWARGYVGQWDWIDVGHAEVDPAPGRILLRPPRVNQRWLPAWPAGRYRIDLLMGMRVFRIDLTIDRDAPTNDAPVSDWSTSAVRDEPIWAVDAPVGPFAVVRGYARPFRVASSGALDIPSAWLADDDTVARDWLPAATALGVVLPAGARAAEGTLRRLVPEEPFFAPQRSIGTIEASPGSPDLAIRFDARPQARIEPGIYAIDAAWTGPDGPAVATWTIELEPAPGMTTAPPALLEAARFAAQLPGGDAIVRDASFGLGPPHRWIEPVAGDEPCDPTFPSPAVAIVLSDPPEASIEAVRVARTDVRGSDVSVRTAHPTTGVTLVVPARSYAFEAGAYTVSVDGARPRALGFCVPADPGG